MLQVPETGIKLDVGDSRTPRLDNTQNQDWVMPGTEGMAL